MEIAHIPLTLGDAAAHLAATMPHQVLCRDVRQALSARDLQRQATALAQALHARGFRPGDRAALLLPAHPETLVAAVAVTQAGGQAALLLPEYGAAELVRMLSLAPPQWLFFAPEHAPEAAAIANAFRPQQVLVQDDGDTGAEDAIPWRQLLQEGAEHDAPLPQVTPDDDALILFTSGSTGTPKAIIHTHNSALSHGALLNRYSDFTAEATMTFRRFRYEEIGQILAGGGAFLLADVTRPRSWQALDAGRRTTHFFGVASDLEICLAQVERGAIAFEALRCIMVGGMATRPELVAQARALLGRPPLLAFGSMETGLLAVHDGRPGLPADCIGLPAAGKELRLLNDGRPVLPGEVGELAARPLGALELGFARGYAGSEQSPWEDGWVYTGDLMVADEAGHLQMVGRRLETINVGGHKVYAPEVERVLRQHPAVAEAAVVAEPDERRGQRPLAYVELAPGHTAPARALRAHCRAHLAPHKIPRRIQFRQALPRTATGKVDKGALQEKPTEATVKSTA